MAAAAAAAGLLLCAAAVVPQGIAGAYFGKLIGPIKTNAHGFTGNVYAANDYNVIITDLNYDGKGPEAFFWAGTGKEPDDKGHQIPDENGSSAVLKAYKNARVLLTLPKKITDYQYLGIYCRKFGANFGHVSIPSGFELPREQSLGPLATKAHEAQATQVFLKDSATMELKQFKYDGQGPAAFFVVAPSVNARQADMVKLLDENGKDSKLGWYGGKDVVLKLPDGRHWNEFRWFSVYCFQASLSFADIAIDAAEELPVHNPSSVAAGSTAVSHAATLWVVACLVAALVS
ncbi:protein Skeletor, isoforms B/C-like [Dermacentor variabilis]|uniref:protein Skeletor, isoforms B/C-like n=1 Tax=Dermacentor variabilis TaxID=34621 RepID=UPI003F5C0AA6